MDDTAFTESWMRQLGFETDGSEVVAFLNAASYSTLEAALGLELADALVGKSKAELVRLTELGDNDAISEWLSSEVPDYRDRVDLALDELKSALTWLSATASR
jgi:hypothetical protein